MENITATSSTSASLAWPPSPLSTDIDEIASYMRAVHAAAASRDRTRSTARTSA